MDYVNLKFIPTKKGNFFAKLLLYFFFMFLGCVITIAVQKYFSVADKHLTINSKKVQVLPKLHFYDALVNNKDVRAKHYPYLLLLGAFNDRSLAQDASKGLNGNVSIVPFYLDGSRVFNVVLGPYKNLLDVYKAKIENKGHALSLINNID